MLKKIECVYVVCDGCGEDAENMDGFICHFPAELAGEAEEAARNADWTVWDGRHWCENCLPLCSTCGHLFGEHDYGEAECQEEGCSCQAFTVKEVE